MILSLLDLLTCSVLCPLISTVLRYYRGDMSSFQESAGMYLVLILCSYDAVFWGGGARDRGFYVVHGHGNNCIHIIILLLSMLRIWNWCLFILQVFLPPCSLAIVQLCWKYPQPLLKETWAARPYQSKVSYQSHTPNHTATPPEDSASGNQHKSSRTIPF
jgi:hypothetical protein